MKKYEKPVLIKQTVSLGEFFMSGCGGNVTMGDLQALDVSYELIALNIEGASGQIVGSTNISS